MTKVLAPVFGEMPIVKHYQEVTNKEDYDLARHRSHFSPANMEPLGKLGENNFEKHISEVRVHGAGTMPLHNKMSYMVERGDVQKMYIQVPKTISPVDV